MVYTDKENIKEKLKRYISQFDSAAKAANSMKGVSSATISQIVNDNWDLVSDQMWLTIDAQTGSEMYDKSGDWVYVETRDFLELNKLLDDAKINSLSMGVIGRAGSCKSKTFEFYKSKNKNTYVLTCNEFWSRQQFLEELLSAMGYSCSGLKVSEMMREISKRMIAKSDPIIIMDEVDKLSDSVLLFYITLYNILEDRCGFILCATDHLEKRLKRGLRLNKRGYNEIYSRLGRRLIELDGLTYTDVFQVCTANGVTDKASIKAVWDDCDCDMRRVKRKIHAIKKQRLNGN